MQSYIELRGQTHALEYTRMHVAAVTSMDLPSIVCTLADYLRGSDAKGNE
jgi:hypothetical protein